MDDMRRWIGVVFASMRLSVDIKRDDVQKIPLTYVAMRGLSRRKKKIINKCIITRGIHLKYSEMKKMVRNAFGPTKSPCCVLVHRMSKCDISAGYMRIPKRVVEPTMCLSMMLMHMLMKVEDPAAIKVWFTVLS
ncbi:hypothetical protein ZWY2020_007016 [Hordeum vulgare]|nr:hypothetical protein ZWY2020_007016 [Hordeum vulgare]